MPSPDQEFVAVDVDADGVFAVALSNSQLVDDEELAERREYEGTGPWYCEDCGARLAGEERPTPCLRCGGIHVRSASRGRGVPRAAAQSLLVRWRSTRGDRA